MVRRDWCSEDSFGEHSDWIFFPPRISRRRPDWLRRDSCASDYEGLLDEVYAALHADSRRLAIMGARAIVDLAIRRAVGDHHNFAQGLDALEKSDLIGKRDRAMVEAAIEAGSAAIHRGHQPTEGDVNVAIDIVERMIQSETLAVKAKELAASTPRRERRPPNT